MFASHVFGPVAETQRQDRRREDAAERRLALARASAREAGTSAGGVSWAFTTAVWLARIYLPPGDPGVRTQHQDQMRQESNDAASGVSWASTKAAWLSRVVDWLSDRRARAGDGSVPTGGSY